MTTHDTNEPRLASWLPSWFTKSVLGILLMYAASVAYATYLFAPCDDTYIYLVYVNNLLNGNGLTFNGDKVQGFTSPLWVAMISAGGLLTRALPFVAEKLSLLSGLFVLTMTFYVGRRAGLSRMFSLLAVLLVATTGDFAFYMSSGMETTFHMGMVLWAVSYLFCDDPRRALTSWLLPVVLGLMILTRPESGIVAVAVIAFLAWRSRYWVGAARAIAITAAVVLPAVIAARLYYGSFLPNTYYAKTPDGFVNVSQGLTYLKYWVFHKPVVVLALLVVLVVRWRHLPAAAFVLVGVTIVSFAYVVKQGGDNLVGHRAFLAMMPLIYIVILRGFSGLRPRVVAAAVIVLALLHVANYNFGNVIGSSWGFRVKSHAAQWRKRYPIRVQIARRLKREYPPNALVALNSSGIIPYYSEMPTIDMLGLNDWYIAHEGLRDWRLTYGHQAGDGSYVIGRDPDVILIRHSGTMFISERALLDSPIIRRRYMPVEYPGGVIAYIRPGGTTKPR